MYQIQDVYNLFDLYSLGDVAGGQYVEINTIADWRTRFPYYAARAKFLGIPDEQAARVTKAYAAYQDRVWGTSPNGTATACNSYADIFLGTGQYAWNAIADWQYGKVFGTSSAKSYPSGGLPRGGGGTEIVVYTDKFITDPTCYVNLPELGTQNNLVMTPFRSVSWNSEGTVGAYHEQAKMDAIHITTNAAKGFKAGRLTAGFLAWDLGTGSELGNIYGDNLDTLMLATRGTPGQIKKLTIMGGNLPMVMLLGAVDAPYDFESLECDDAPAVFMTRPQWGREGGARIQFDVIKIETGVTSESRNPWTGTIIADLKGRNILDGGIVNFAEASVNVGDLVVIDDLHSNGQQPNLVKYTLGKWNVEANLVHEVNGNVYPSPGVFPWDAQEVFYYRFAGTRKMEVNRVDVAPLAGVTGYKSRLGFQRYVGSGWTPPFNHATGSPSFTYQNAGGSSTAPPPTGCTWVLGTPGAWSACVNGSQTMTTPYVSSVAGCTPTTAKPADKVETQACTVTPPPSGTPVWATTFSGTNKAVLVATTGANIAPAASYSTLVTAPNGTATTNLNTCFLWASGKASKVVLLGVKLTTAPNYTAITTNHIVYPDGKVYYRNGDSSTDVATGVTMATGTRYDRVELPCPAGVLRGVLGGPLATGSSQAMTIEGMELY